MYNWDLKLYSSNSSPKKEGGLALVAKLLLKGKKSSGCGLW
jgi:hypothetical protein